MSIVYTISISNNTCDTAMENPHIIEKKSNPQITCFWSATCNNCVKCSYLQLCYHPGNVEMLVILQPPDSVVLSATDMPPKKLIVAQVDYEKMFNIEEHVSAFHDS
jgi:hypothetical protein